MKLIMLGTGNATVTEYYNTCFVIQDEDKYFMVDGGGGNTILKQLKAAGLDWKNMREIFVTHKHVDHILGILWIIRMIGQNMAKGKLSGDYYIYGHEEVIFLLRELTGMLLNKKETQFIGNGIYLVVVEDGESKMILDRQVTFFDICSTKAKQFGFTMDMGDGEKLTCCGDEPYNACEEKYVRDSKWLLHEAFCLYSQADIFEPYEKHHSTAKDACELAAKLHVENIVLYHTEDKNKAERKKLYTKEGRQVFSGNIFVPEDLEEIIL